MCLATAVLSAVVVLVTVILVAAALLFTAQADCGEPWCGGRTISLNMTAENECGECAYRASPVAARAAHMPKWNLMPDMRMLAPDDWRILRNISLSALRESPRTFLSRYEDEKVYDEASWRAEFVRGDWYVGIAEGQSADEPISLVGITRESRTPAHHRFLEYLWVAPEFRGHGVAFDMIILVLDRLKRSGVRTVFLWVLDGNDSARRLYKRLGFISCNHRQPLKAQPGRSEELMKMDLG